MDPLQQMRWKLSQQQSWYSTGPQGDPASPLFCHYLFGLGTAVSVETIWQGTFINAFGLMIAQWLLATDFHLKENQIKTQVVRPGPGQKAMEALGAKNWQAACTALWWN